MQLTTLLRFLMGRRQAIIDVASCRESIFLGALFVLSAGFAREYDGKDLRHEPWHLLVPLIASLVTSFVLYCLFYLGERSRGTGDAEFLPYYRRFLSLYWMTAPLAWIYAIPVEQWMTAGDAMRANLSFLGIVSLWRVLLITRCASVLFGASFVASFFLVMLFADSLALAILALTPLPIFNIMGGISLTESEHVVRETACMVQFFGGISWLVWLIGTIVILGTDKRNWNPLEITEITSPVISKSLWSLAILSLAVWVFLLPSSQPPQRLRRTVESDLLNGHIDRAIQMMSAHDLRSFPPHWVPPPWPGYGQDIPPLLNVLQAISDESTADWVRELLFDKLRIQFERYESNSSFWHSMDDEEFAGYIALFRNDPSYRVLLGKHSVFLSYVIEHEIRMDRGRAKQIRSLLKDLEIEIPGDEESDEESSTYNSDQALVPLDEEPMASE